MKNFCRKFGEIAELAQDANETGNGDAVENRLGIFLVGLSVNLQLTQPVLIPHLKPDQWHFFSLFL
uniref:Protein SCAR2 n=1 Tax=Rhizophora mucronata TaxID=61149 RepID=A0A2P2JTH6_RHIMU